jgi:hypothetical protein
MFTLPKPVVTENRVPRSGRVSMAGRLVLIGCRYCFMVILGKRVASGTFPGFHSLEPVVQWKNPNTQATAVWDQATKRRSTETVATLFMFWFCCSRAAEPLSEGPGITSDKAPPVRRVLFGVAAATISSGAVDRWAASNRGDAGKVKSRSRRQQSYVIERSVGSQVRTRPSKRMN